MNSVRKSWAVRLFAWLSESPLWRPWGYHSEACLLSALRAAAAFLPLSFIKPKKLQRCLCVLQMRRMLSKQVILWAEVDVVCTELSSMGRDVGAASALLFVSTVCLECRIHWVRGEKKLRNALLLSLSASSGSGGREWEGRKRQLVLFFYY